MNYSIEPYVNIIQDIDTFAPNFVSEGIDRYEGSPTPEVDHATFLAMDEAGVLLVVVAREDGEFAGLHVSSINNDLFYRNVIMGYVLFYYMYPEFRGKGRSKGMFEFAIDAMKKKGVERIFMSHKSHMPTHKLFEGLGFTRTEINYTKSLL